MKVIFHLGMKKTGSTTIQRSLYAASETLAKEGILYPQLSRFASHTQLLFAMVKEDELLSTSGRKSPAKRESSNKVSEELWSKLEEQVAAGNYHTLILSSEYAFGISREGFARCMERLRTFADEIHLVGYFRSPASLYLSGAQQTVKFGDTLRNPLDPVNYRKRYKKVHNQGADEVTVRAFDREQLKDGCVCKDFLSICGLPETLANTIEVVSANESISAEAMQVMYDLNHLLSPGERVVGNKFAKGLLARVRTVEEGSSFTKPTLDPTIKKLVVQGNRKDARWLNEKAEIKFGDFSYKQAKSKPVAVEDIDLDLDALQPSDIVNIKPGRLKEMRLTILDQLLDTLMELHPKGTEIKGSSAENKPEAALEFLTRADIRPGKFSGEHTRAKRRMLVRYLARLEKEPFEINFAEDPDGRIFSAIFHALLKAIFKLQSKADAPSSDDPAEAA